MLVMLVKAGVQSSFLQSDSRLRGNDDQKKIL